VADIERDEYYKPRECKHGGARLTKLPDYGNVHRLVGIAVISHHSHECQQQRDGPVGVTDDTEQPAADFVYNTTTTTTTTSSSSFYLPIKIINKQQQ